MMCIIMHIAPAAPPLIPPIYTSTSTGTRTVPLVGRTYMVHPVYL